MQPGVVFVSLLMATIMVSGCLGDGGPATGTTADDPTYEEPNEASIQRVEWDGYILHWALDPFAHMKDPETIVYPVQQAGFLVEIKEPPKAIEVMVAWDDPDAGFRLHPHYTAKYDRELGGETLYYGYLSEMFQASPGCVRIPDADMAAGTWPMMIHPASGTMDVEYTITVGIVGAAGVVLDDRHGHRSDGPAPVEDHGIEPCEFLVAF